MLASKKRELFYIVSISDLTSNQRPLSLRSPLPSHSLPLPRFLPSAPSPILLVVPPNRPAVSAPLPLPVALAPLRAAVVSRCLSWNLDQAAPGGGAFGIGAGLEGVGAGRGGKGEGATMRRSRNTGNVETWS